MIEDKPIGANSALFYFHTRCSCGNEIAPYLETLRRELPHTYVWAGDGPIDGQRSDPIMRTTATYGTSKQRYWFVFPMQSSTAEAFTQTTEAMGGVLVTCGGYVNRLVDQAVERHGLDPARVVLCGHQHGACVALAAAMMRRDNPYGLVVLFDPWPWEMLYLEHERNLPGTRVVCVDNKWVREREADRGAKRPLFEEFRRYGIAAEGITLEEGRDRPDEHMFAEVIRQMKAYLALP